MKKQEEYCPKCDKDVMVNRPWGEVICPECGLKGDWEEDYNGEDEYVYIEWEKE